MQGSMGSSSTSQNPLKKSCSRWKSSWKTWLESWFSPKEGSSGTNSFLIGERLSWRSNSPGSSSPPAASSSLPLSSSSGMRRVLVSSSNCSITLKFLGCFWFCLRLLSFSGLQSLTQLRSTPTFSCSLVEKSKLQNSPRRSWQQQSSRLFLEIPTSRAASCRFSRRLSDLWPCRCRFRHRLTSSITSAIVRSRLRPSRRSTWLSASRLESWPSESAAQSSLRLYLMRMTWGSRYFLWRKPFCAARWSREAKWLALGSQMETLWWCGGQQMERRQFRLIKFCRRSTSQSTRMDCCVSSFSNTKVFIPFYGFIIASNINLIFLIRRELFHSWK